MTPTEEMIAMARECAAPYFPEVSFFDVLAGKHDDKSSVRAALTAIMETSENAIKRDREKFLKADVLGFKQGPMESWDADGRLVLYWNSEDGIASVSFDGSGYAIMFTEIDGLQMLNDAWPVAEESLFAPSTTGSI